MGRPIKIQYPGALYHMTSRGNERRDIFVDDNDRRKFLGILADYHDRLGIVLHCYVLMDNHYDLVLETQLGNLVKVMHGVNSSYTVYFNRRHVRDNFSISWINLLFCEYSLDSGVRRNPVAIVRTL
jgi:putative transposase